MLPKRRLFIVALTLSLSFALAQGAWFETGTLTTVINGEQRLLHTYGMLVPEDVADGVEDPQQRAILERVAGTEQHNASYQYFDEMTLGGFVLAPAKIWVSLSFTFDGSNAGGPHNITVQFPLDPATLELVDPDEVEVTYFPNGPSRSDYFALTAGTLTLEQVEIVDDVTLRISGAFSGVMTHQTEWDIVHDADSAIEAFGEFSVERVVGSQLALELIEGQQ